MNLNGEPTGVAASLAAGCELTVLQESNVLAALALLICRRARQQKRLQLASVLPAASAISNAELWKLTLRPKLLRLAQRKAHDEGPEDPRRALPKGSRTGRRGDDPDPRKSGKPLRQWRIDQRGSSKIPRKVCRTRRPEGREPSAPSTITTRGRVGLNVSHGVPQASVRRRDACEAYFAILIFARVLSLFHSRYKPRLDLAAARPQRTPAGPQQRTR